MPKLKSLKIGIVGCGAIGSRIAKSITHELKASCQLTGLYDIDTQKSQDVAQQLKQKKAVKSSFSELLKSCDLMVEAVNATDTHTIIEQALKAKRHVLAMSVGKLLNALDLFRLARKNHCNILIPSGAIAGIDAIKAVRLAKINKITLTTRKPLAGFIHTPYVIQNKIDLTKIHQETVIFEGNVDTAVKFFPQNINVAATVSLAAHAQDKLTVRIITSPSYTKNIHEVEVTGDFGRIVTRTENEVCPDNPKTSYLAVLSGIQTLQEFCTQVKIGT